MRRRQLLTLAAVGLAGCLSDSSPGSSGTDDGSMTGTDTTTRTPALSPTTTDTTPTLEPYPGDCPDYGDRVTRTVCSSAAPEDVPLRATPSKRSVDLPGSVSVTLRNHTDAEFQTNHHSGRLHKQVDGEWFHVAPTGWPEPLTPLPAGESHTWTVYLDGDPAPPAEPGPGSGSNSETTRSVGGVGGGRYAFGNDGWFPGQSYENSTAAIATFDVVGPPAELTTTDAVTDVSVDGETLTARWTGGHDGEHSSEATFVLRTTDGDAPHRLITEQVLQPGLRPPPLRDALALSVGHDVGEVRLTGATGSTPPFGVGEATLFECGGRTYEVSAGETAEQ